MSEEEDPSKVGVCRRLDLFWVSKSRPLVNYKQPDSLGARVYGVHLFSAYYAVAVFNTHFCFLILTTVTVIARTRL